MERPSRNKRTVNYSDFLDDDDEDFADAKTPPVKKARPREPEVKRSSKAEGQEGPPPAPGREERASLEDLEAALALSLLQAPETRDEVKIPDDPSAQAERLMRLTNCSVDASLHGLDRITPEQTGSGRKKRSGNDGRDEEYEPRDGSEPESDADSDFTDEESEDEGFTAKKGQKKAARVTARTVKRCRNERKPTKASKARARSAGPPAGSSPVTQPRTVPRTTPTTPPVSSSPAGSRVPKWNPPGQVGRSPSASPGVSVKSPGQGLRLGLSRLARVKPLHPNGAAHHPPHPFPNAVI
ncbi:RAD51-associated protein 1 isoform X2 [Denticeps clupeoides]|uniref:RAD51-associated protein 1 isoform X2 n=1 Tax=Denticeps clupeoides TaxID=299321 RepID=UPI0010A30AAC|nr:RAD51-associated protein 1 isoform X2 [Denticeps clupeoides]